MSLLYNCVLLISCGLACWKLKRSGAFDYFSFFVQDISQKTYLFSVIPGLHSVLCLKANTAGPTLLPLLARD